MTEGGPLGYLVINVLEAAGHDSEDAVVWDPDFKQGYARGAPGRCCFMALLLSRVEQAREEGQGA